MIPANNGQPQNPSAIHCAGQALAAKGLSIALDVVGSIPAVGNLVSGSAASIFDLNLSGTTGPAPTILGKTGAAEVIGWVSGAFELKLAADIGATAAEALNCIGHR